MKASLIVLCLFVCLSACSQQVKNKKPVLNNDTAYVYRAASADGTGKFYLGREIAHVMDASGSDWLDRPGRPAQENTELVISSMQLTDSVVVADVGAGTGYYTFRIAPKVPAGKVYAVEIQEELIDILNQKKADSGVSNVEVLRGDTNKVNLPDSAIDIAIMVDVYHELSWPKEIIQSISKSLKRNGKIMLVEYRGEDPAVRIRPLHKTTVLQLTREMAAHGFILERRVDDLPIQHFLVFKRK